MTIINIKKSFLQIKKAAAEYYNTQPSKITTNEYGQVFLSNRKTKTQIAQYKNLFVFAFVK